MAARKKTLAELMTGLIRKAEERLEKGDLKPTVADYIRLRQMEKELEEKETPREIKVTWVEPGEEEHANEE